MAERGYLLLLIGAGLMVFTALPMINFGFLFAGMLLILNGVINMRTSAKELEYAKYSAIIALVCGLILSFFVRPLSVQLVILVIILQLFFEISTFFWLFKAEYMWSPQQRRRIDWLIYTFAAGLHLLVTMFLYLPVIGFRVLPLVGIFNLFNVQLFTMFLHYGVLIFILVKLYLEAKGNAPGLRRWR